MPQLADNRITQSQTAETRTAETQTAGAAGPRRRVRALGDPLRTAAAVLAAIAVLSAAWFGWSWYDAAHDDSLTYSRSRDAVLLAAEQAITNLNTLDYRDVRRGLDLWQESTTGELHDEIVAGRMRFEQQVQQARTVSAAKVIEGAVTQLDDRAGTASVIVAVQITVTPPDGQPATKQSRLIGRLTRTPGGWKLSALGQAPVGGSAPSAVQPSVGGSAPSAAQPSVGGSAPSAVQPSGQ